MIRTHAQTQTHSQTQYDTDKCYTCGVILPPSLKKSQSERLTA